MASLFSLFTRRPPAPSAPPPRVTLEISSRAETIPTPGLVVIDIGFSSDPAGAALLQVFLGDETRPAFQTTLSLDPQPQPYWVAIHGHLLADGPNTVRVALTTPAGVRLAEQARTVQVVNQGPLAEATRASLKRVGAPRIVDACDSTTYDYADERLTAWHDRSLDAVEAHLAGLAAAGAADPEEIEALRHFAARGYLVMPDAIEPDHLTRLNAAMDDAVARKVEGYEWGASQRLHDLHKLYPAIDDLWRHPRILRMLSLIFDAPARPYQTLTYVFGSEQFHHQDTIVLTPFPAGRMCGVWTALEDIQPDSGELVIYPGSHRLPRTYMRDLGIPKVKEDWTAFGEAVSPVWNGFIYGHFGEELYRPEAGAVLIWHENLMHGGKVRAEKTRSRRSIVGHYFAEGCVAYHDANGMPGSLNKV